MTEKRPYVIAKSGISADGCISTYSGDWKWYKQAPSWFVREFMTVPKRAACRNWEKQAIYADDFEEIEDCPDFGRKPHIYFW